MEFAELSPDEWEKLFTSYKNLAFTAVRSGGAPDEDAAVNDTFLRLVTSAKNKADLWTNAARRINTLGHQQAVNQLRSPAYGGGRHANKARSLGAMLPSRQHALRATPSLERTVVTGETLMEAWGELREDERTILYGDYTGSTRDETGKRLGRSRQQLKTAVFAARKRLRQKGIQP